MKRWFYIVFFNAVWAVFPLWVLRHAYMEIGDTFRIMERTRQERHLARDIPSPGKAEQSDLFHLAKNIKK